MSRAKAVQTSKDRLAANFIIAIPVAALLFVIWTFQKPKAPTTNINGWRIP